MRENRALPSWVSRTMPVVYSSRTPESFVTNSAIGVVREPQRGKHLCLEDAVPGCIPDLCGARIREDDLLPAVDVLDPRGGHSADLDQLGPEAGGVGLGQGLVE